MLGQGRPLDLKAKYCFVFLVLSLLCFLIPVDRSKGEEESGTRIRFTWGGNQASVWRGKVQFPKDSRIGNLKILGLESDQPGRIYVVQNTVHVELAKASMFGGFEIDFVPTDDTKIEYSLSDPNNGDTETSSDSFQLRQLFDSPISVELKNSKNRIFISRSPNDSIKVITNRKSLVFRGREEFEFSVAISQHEKLDSTQPKQLTITLQNAQQPNKAPWSKSVESFNPKTVADFQLPIPAEAGAYQLRIQLSEKSSIPFTPARNLMTRTIEFAVAGDFQSKKLIDSKSNLELVFTEEAGKPVWIPMIGRIRKLEKFNSSARDLLIKKVPIFKGLGGKDYFSIAPNGWKTFSTALEGKQQLIIFEVDFLVDQAGTYDLLLLDRWDKNLPNESVVANQVMIRQQDTDGTPKKQTHRFLAWTRSDSPQLLVHNRSEKAPCLIQQIRVYQVKDADRDYIFSSNQHRRLFASIDAEEFFQSVSAPKALDNGNPLDGWDRFFTGGQRLIHLLKNSGYQGSVISINPSGSSLYPSDMLQPTPKLDTAIFATSASDPIRKDVLELLFLQFDSNNLTLVPKIQIPRYIAKLEVLVHTLPSSQFDDLRLRDGNGKPSATYNMLNPRVQAAISELVLEVVDRYSHHPSFGGITIEVGENQQLAFPTNQVGYNETIVKKFIEKKPIELVSNEKFSSLADKVQSLHAKEFQNWRNEQLASYLSRLNDLVVTKSRKRLLVDTSKLVLETNHQSPRLRGSSKTTPRISNGVSNALLAKNGLGYFHLLVRSKRGNLADRKLEFAHRQSTFSLDSSISTYSQTVQRLVVAPEKQMIAQSGIKRTNSPLPSGYSYTTTSADSNRQFREDLIGEIARHDCLLLVDGSDLLRRSLTNNAKQIWTSFTKLPNVSFDSVTKNNLHSPVVVRTKSIGTKSYFYVVNQSPWPSRVSLSFSTPLANLRSVDGKFFDKLKKSETGGMLELDLKPYDLVVAESDQAELKMSGVSFSLPESLSKSLVTEKDQLLARIRFLPEPKSVGTFKNPSFDSVDESGFPLNWKRSADPSFLVRTAAGIDGAKSLVLQHEKENQWGWVRSQYLRPTKTGRLSLVVSMKKTDAEQTPHVRLSLEGEHQQDEYYRFGSFSAEKSQSESTKIESDWKVFAVHFDDVPTDLKNVKVGLDVFGKGTVQLDNFRVFDNWFDAEDQDALSKIATLAGHKISEGELLHAHRLINGYWPSFIRNYADKPSRNQ